MSPGFVFAKILVSSLYTRRLGRKTSGKRERGLKLDVTLRKEGNHIAGFLANRWNAIAKLTAITLFNSASRSSMCASLSHSDSGPMLPPGLAQ